MPAKGYSRLNVPRAIWGAVVGDDFDRGDRNGIRGVRGISCQLCVVFLSFCLGFQARRKVDGEFVEIGVHQLFDLLPP